MSHNAKLACIANEAAENLKDLVRAHEEKILEAWNAAEQEAQDNDQKPKFRMSLAITLDLDADKMMTDLTFGIRYKGSRDQTIPDPDQTNLPLEESTVTISTDGIEPVTLTAQQCRNAARKLSKR